MRYFIMILTFGLVACTNTHTVIFDPSEAEGIPTEVAVDTVESFSRMSGRDAATTCILKAGGAVNKNGGNLIPYNQINFTAKNYAYTPVDLHPHLYLFNKVDNSQICSALIVVEPGYGKQSFFERTFKWIGSAMLSLGATYIEADTK
jgi:hypothetical protein